MQRRERAESPRFTDARGPTRLWLTQLASGSVFRSAVTALELPPGVRWACWAGVKGTGVARGVTGTSF